MSALSPRILVGIGFVLVVIGVVVPFLMVMKIIPSTFFLNFLSFTASVSGLVMGMYGAAMYVREHRRKR